MTPSRTYAAAGLLAALLLGLLGMALVGAGPASAAARTVTLTGSGPAPASITISVGDAITFTNADQLGLSHVVRSTGPGWSYGPTTVAGGGSVTTATFPAPGTYRYNDHRNTIGSDAAGAIVVTAPPAPRPAPAASSVPAAAPASSPTASGPAADGPPARLPSEPVAPPQPTQPPVSASAVAPQVAVVPAVGAAPTAAPLPSGTPGPDPTDAATAGPTAVKGSVNSSNHQQAYGLPAALAAVLIGGVLSVLVRLLLAHPAGRRAAVPPGA